jgi:KAP family P-loop domain
LTETKTPFSQPDFLSRDEFLRSLEHHIDGLAEIPLEHLVSPRVLAVDAPWGSGKSWIAERLSLQLQSEDKLHRVAFIDAFRYDHHDDAFAVIAAAVMKALKPDAEQKKKYVKAAGAVLKGAAPMIVKAGASLALKFVGLDGDDVAEAFEDSKEAAIDGVSKASEKAVEKLLDSYANTQVVQEEFIKTLSTLTKNLPKPFVVIIDELDRCRPSFALEFLERIKHLFAAQNVVFVLFWNATSICESVRHSYGQGTNAELYLSKFVAFSVSIPVKANSRSEVRSRHEPFIRNKVAVSFHPKIPNGADVFVDSLAEFADYFDASLRDLEKVVEHFKRIPQNRSFSTSDFAYVALLKVRSESSFVSLLAKDRSLFSKEAERFARAGTPGDRTYAREMFLVHTFLADESSFRNAFANQVSKPLSEMDLEVQLEIHRNGGSNRHEWLFQAAKLLNDALTRPSRH